MFHVVLYHNLCFYDVCYTKGLVSWVQQAVNFVFVSVCAVCRHRVMWRFGSVSGTNTGACIIIEVRYLYGNVMFTPLCGASVRGTE